ncbi:MAG: RluA family pseudouridine synthase [Pseudomonadota bacterium]
MLSGTPQSDHFAVEHDSGRHFCFSVSDGNKDQRIDTFLSSHVPELTRSRVQDLIKSGLVRVNDRLPKTSYRLKVGDEISLRVPPPRNSPIEPENIDFTLIHEDASLIVLNKPAGLVIHPAPGHPMGTLVHGLLYHCKDLSGVGGILRPGIVHRLDKDTSGLMVVAKNDRAHASLSNQFESRIVKKRYCAIVYGILREKAGKIDLPISRHPKRRKEMSVLSQKGKSSTTLWEKIEEFRSGFSLLSVTPKTGRTHQIRVHLSYAGHPIVGDKVYGQRIRLWKKNSTLDKDLLNQVERQMLHAETLGFIHPDTGDYMEFTSSMPRDMVGFLDVLRKRDLENKID